MVMERVEKALGLPPLKATAEALQKFPDARQLRLIKDVLEIAERVAQTVPELDKVLELIKEINAVPLEKMQTLEKTLKHMAKIVEKAPGDILSFLTANKTEPGK